MRRDLDLWKDDLADALSTLPAEHMRKVDRALRIALTLGGHVGT